MQITIDRTSPIPIYLQIRNQVREMIVSGMLPAGFRLPPERKLAESLGVNRSTVVSAYRELEADGMASPTSGRAPRSRPAPTMRPPMGQSRSPISRGISSFAASPRGSESHSPGI